MSPEILTVPQVSALLECSEDKAAELLTEGTLPGLKFGRSWIMPAAALYERLNQLALEQAAVRRKPPEPGTAARGPRQPPPLGNMSAILPGQAVPNWDRPFTIS